MRGKDRCKRTAQIAGITLCQCFGGKSSWESGEVHLRAAIALDISPSVTFTHTQRVFRLKVCGSVCEATMAECVCVKRVVTKIRRVTFGS